MNFCVDRFGGMENMINFCPRSSSPDHRVVQWLNFRFSLRCRKQLVGPTVSSSASSSAKFSFVLLRLDMHMFSVLFTYRILLLDGVVLVEAHFTVLHFAIWVKLVTVIAEKGDGIVS